MEGENTDWRNEVTELHEKLKVTDGESKKIKFLDEGIKFKNQYGTSIVFNVETEGQKYTWYVNTQSVGLLASIKRMDIPLTGKEATLSRTGVGKSDTKWILEPTPGSAGAMA